MPREVARRSSRRGTREGGLEFEIRQHDEAVRVTLSGILDRRQWQRLRQRLAPLLRRRARCIILDGRHLRHIDFRVVRDLIEWNHALRAFGHRLLLAGWSDYLRSILCVEDWARELCPDPVPFAAWRPRDAVRPGQRR